MVSSKRNGSRQKSRWVLGLLVAAGALSGQLVNAARAHACRCISESWNVERSAVISSDPSVDHSAYWPQTAILTSYPGRAHVSATSHVAAGKVERAGAGP